MRYCGEAFRDDATFLESGRAEARRLVRDFGVGIGTAILEIGCGPARLPIGLIDLQVEIAGYDGIDIDTAAIDWCRRYITRRHPRFRFHRVEARHPRYNPSGPPMSDGFRLAFGDGSFDLIYLHSVFANMEPGSVAVYCREFARVLRPDGVVFLTAFIEPGVADFTINPENYRVASSGPMNVVRFDRAYFFGLIAEAGLMVSHFAHADDLGGQSTVHLRRAHGS